MKIVDPAPHPFTKNHSLCIETLLHHFFRYNVQIFFEIFMDVGYYIGTMVEIFSNFFIHISLIFSNFEIFKKSKKMRGGATWLNFPYN